MRIHTYDTWLQSSECQLHPGAIGGAIVAILAEIFNNNRGECLQKTPELERTRARYWLFTYRSNIDNPPPTTRFKAYIVSLKPV